MFSLKLWESCIVPNFLVSTCNKFKSPVILVNWRFKDSNDFENDSDIIIELSGDSSLMSNDTKAKLYDEN